MVLDKETTNHPTTTIHVKWAPPTMGTYKLNIDGAIKKSNRGLGGVFRDHRGNWVIGFTEKKPLTNSILAELQALHRELILGIN